MSNLNPCPHTVRVFGKCRQCGDSLYEAAGYPPTCEHSYSHDYSTFCRMCGFERRGAAALPEEPTRTMPIGVAARIAKRLALALELGVWDAPSDASTWRSNYGEDVKALRDLLIRGASPLGREEPK